MILLLALLIQDDPAATLKKLREEYTKAETEYYRPYREAKTNEERAKVKLDPAKHPAREYHPKFVELAGAAKGTRAGADAWKEALRLALSQQMKKEAAAALDALATDYAGDEALENLPQQLVYAGWTIGQEKVEGVMRTLSEKSPHIKVRAAAGYYLAYTILYVNNGADPKGEAKKLLDGFKDSYAETTYAKLVGPLLFELENLQIGMVAPEIEAVDQKGEKWKLSDYRGKVVVIDFWGFW